MTDLHLDRLRKIAQAATPGPWHLEPSGESNCSDGCCHEYWYTRIRTDDAIVTESHHLTDEDAQHIAAFDPPRALALLGEIERLRGVLAAIKSILDGQPACDKYPADADTITCGWKSDVLRIRRVLDEVEQLQARAEHLELSKAHDVIEAVRGYAKEREARGHESIESCQVALELLRIVGVGQ